MQKKFLIAGISCNSNWEAPVRRCNPCFLGSSENGFMPYACVKHKYTLWNNWYVWFTIAHSADPVRKSPQHHSSANRVMPGLMVWTWFIFIPSPLVLGYSYQWSRKLYTSNSFSSGKPFSLGVGLFLLCCCVHRKLRLMALLCVTVGETPWAKFSL